MMHKIDEADLGVWRADLADCLELLNLLCYESDGEHAILPPSKHEQLRTTIGDVYDAIGIAVENSREAKSD